MFKSSSFVTCSLLCVVSATAYAQSAAQNTLRQTTLPVQPLVVRTNSQEPSAAKEIATQVPRARAILDGWQNTNPQRADRFIRLVYWTPADREPAPMYRERLSKIMLDIQNFYAFEMNRNGFGPRTFKLQKDAADGLLQIYLAHGDKPRSEYSVKTGDEIRRDCIAELKKAGIDGDKETFLIFCNLSDWDPKTRTVSGDSPYYASGTTRSGTAWQSDSPVLTLEGLTDTSEAHKLHNQYGFTTLARYSSIFIGGIAHELGHALSMPHDRQRDDQLNWGHSLMDTGNRTYGEDLRPVALKDESNGHGAFLTLPDAMRLASHPSFSGSVKGIEGEPNAVLSDVKITTAGKRLTYSARVKANPPVYGIVAYFDPAGVQDYNSRTTSAVPDKNGNFSITFAPTDPGKVGQLRIVTLQANGAASSAAVGNGTSPHYPYAVNADGTIDLSLWDTTQRISPLLATVKAQDLAAANAELKTLEAQNASATLLEVARVQIANLQPTTKATPAEAKSNSLFLSEAQPSSATVGWLTPTYNSLPEEEGVSPLFISGGKIFARGIYAHAPAQHSYDLGGKWNRFSGTVGTLQGQGGGVGFTIYADDKEVWKHKGLKEGDLATFDVPVQGVKTLKLVTDNSTDGTGSDWALWLNPLLAR